MNKMGKIVAGVLLGLIAVGSAHAAIVPVNADISISTTWTADNEYQLKKQIFVTNGATLSIQPGTLVRSLVADQGSLAVTRGSKIYVNGTESNPVIMTSSKDDLVTPRYTSAEWGNLTIMGQGYVSNSFRAGNTATPTGLNISQMEGLSSIPNDTNPLVLYGGPNDDDDSGSIHYLSLRYGGKVIGFANELNGLSLGGVGRGTDIDHVEIFSNVDDGIEIWGGAVNLKYVSIWNIGDDSLDVDQGWRGKAQFGLIVQGYNIPEGLTAPDKQGGGVGDNCIETDGAENSDAQPVSTVKVYNFTIIGQPSQTNPGGDHGTAWRDGARVQYRNCIWMDLGEDLIKNDNIDGDGSLGYGHNGTLPFTLAGVSNDIWDTAYSEMWNTANPATGGHPNAGGLTAAQLQVLYPTQTDGFLAEIKDSVFYNNVKSTAYTTSDAVGVTVGGGSNPALNNIVATVSPVVNVTRGSKVTLIPISETKIYDMYPVIGLDPRANTTDSNTSAGSAPADGFFTPAQFRGAFSKDVNWLLGWTASDAYGIHAGQTNPKTNTIVELKGTVVTFSTILGAKYMVEESTDGINYSLFQVVNGTGADISVASLTGYEAGKLYRVKVL